MSSEWVVLELGPKAEGEDPDLVRRSIRGTLRDAEVYIPAAVTAMGDDKVVRYLVEGYAFVKRAHPDASYLRLENTKYVVSVLTTAGRSGGGRSLAVVNEREIEKMRSQVRAEAEQGIGVGDTVLITSGPYRQITAVVYEDIPEHDAVQVFVKLRSKEALVSLPRNFLRLVTKAIKALPQFRGEDLVAWLQNARGALSWRERPIHGVTIAQQKFTLVERFAQELPPLVRSFKLAAFKPIVDSIQEKAKELVKIVPLSDRAHPLVQAIKQASRPPLDPTPIQEMARKWEEVTIWEETVKNLAAEVRPFYRGGQALAKVESKYLDWDWVRSAMDRLTEFRKDVQVLEEQLFEESDIPLSDVPHTRVTTTLTNILVDGLNLAIRCLFAPGLGALKDKKGRPTGVYVGFLRSLGALRKKWPGSTIYVCWDGSSKRRKALYEGYKSNRQELPLSVSEIEWLREVLPLLGVKQAWNPNEEADDVIATLVSTTLAGQRNVIFSTDKDLFQLVDDRTSFLSPAVGKSPEKLYDLPAMIERWGVGPESIVTLRAFLGDASDKIPGVAGFPEKVAVKLVKAYGTVDRIFTALPSISGLTKNQYAKVKDAEADVRRNIGLMSLHRDLPISEIPVGLNRKAAEERLIDVDVKPETILAALVETPAPSGIADGA